MGDLQSWWEINVFQELQANSPEQMAEIAVFQGRVTEAETILLHNKNYALAMDICLRLHRWERALEIAKSSPNKSDIQLILSKRKEYLMALNCNEYSGVFIQCTNGDSGHNHIIDDNS